MVSAKIVIKSFTASSDLTLQNECDGEYRRCRLDKSHIARQP